MLMLLPPTSTSSPISVPLSTSAGTLPQGQDARVRGFVGRLLLGAADALGGRARRGLTVAERSVLAGVFGDGLDLDPIVVVPDRAGLLGLSRRPVTLGTSIHLKGAASPGLLVHEAVHVWQYRRLGARYALDAVRAQCSRTGYDWRAPGTDRFAELNVEAQAQFLQDLVTTPAVGTDHPALAADALASVRAPSHPPTTWPGRRGRAST
jgi:hypothetical protein